MMNVIIVDDHPLIRLGIKSSLSVYKDEIRVVGEAPTADELFLMLPKVETDLILLDIQMPGMSSEDAVKKLKSEYSNIKIIIVSSNCEEETIFRLVELGIDGFVPKMSDVTEIRNAIYKVSLGSNYYGGDMSKIIKAVNNSKKLSASLMSEFTDREKEVMHLCCDGLLSKEIASQLNISSRTVEMHKSNIFKKLGINSTIELLKWAIGHGVVKL
mgnify:FL=1